MPIATAALHIISWLIISSASTAALAQTPPFPNKAIIEITVLFPAGSSADVTARLLADGLSRQLATTVIITNRPGAGGAIGYRYVASQKPDGTALVWSSNSISTTYHSGMMPLNYEKFEHVAQALVETPVLAVLGTAKWKTLAEFIAAAKANPKHLTIANSGSGSHTHISSVALFRTGGAEVVDVPFGAAQVIPSLLGGQVDAALQLPSALTVYVKSGQLRLLAAMARNRDPAFPDVPTAREQGLDISLEAWRGIAAPKGTPETVLATLETAIQRTVESREFAQACERIGARPAFLPGTRFAPMIAKEDAELAGIMQAMGMKKPP